MISGCGRNTCWRAASLGRCSQRSACQSQCARGSPPEDGSTENVPAYRHSANRAASSAASPVNRPVATSRGRRVRISTTATGARTAARIAPCDQESSRCGTSPFCYLADARCSRGGRGSGGSSDAPVVTAEVGRVHLLAGQVHLTGDVRAQPYPVAVDQPDFGARGGPVVVDEGPVGGALVANRGPAGVVDGHRRVPPGDVVEPGERRRHQ